MILAITAGLCATAARADPAPAYVGAAVCASCHAQQAAQWKTSHHAQSMQVADQSTVLGNFNDVRFREDGQTAHFFKRGKDYWVEIEGKDGKPNGYPVAYTFGVYPLQQYLIPFPDGRLQALGIAWDSRPRDAGGQHWFALYPNQHFAPDDPLHWTGRDQNWNFMCASCHSTDVHRNYDAKRDRFDTRWSEINVACESCHGPGKRHVELARDKRLGKVDPSGLTNSFAAAARAPHEEEACYACHSRRQEIVVQAPAQTRFLDRYLPLTLESGSYQPDGQIQDEVFEYGSFLQSKMHAAGVTCTHCHEPHSLQLRANGNALCTQCHQAAQFDRPEHHHHATASTGSACVNCHMPQRIYMMVHVRHDHSLRIPRPDLTQIVGTSNACTQCHSDRKASWAAEQIARWTGKSAVPNHFSLGLAAIWRGAPAANAAAPALSGDLPPFVRAGALTALRAPLDAATVNTLRKSAKDHDGLVRMGAARALAQLDRATAAQIGAALLGDPLRAVRIEAARSLAGIKTNTWSSRQRRDLTHALDELIAAELAAADRPESHVNLSQLYRRLGRFEQAERALNTALRLSPNYIPALVDLADLYRESAHDDQAEPLLRKAVAQTSPAATPAFALGLLLVRTNRLQEALPWLARAAELDDANASYAQVLALALFDSGQRQAAFNAIDRALRRLPDDPTLQQTRQDLLQRRNLVR